MGKISCLVGFVLFALVTFLVSCEDKEFELVSSEKVIKSFKIADTSPEIIGTISEYSKTITLTIPSSLESTNLIPVLEISDKATVTPASELAQDFSKPLVYNVIAEDGTNQEYQIKLVVIAPPIVKSHLGGSKIERDDFIIINGANFQLNNNTTKVIFESISSEYTLEIPIDSYFSSNTQVVAYIPADTPLGNYRIGVMVGTQSAYLDGIYTITLHRPVIESLNHNTVSRGDKLKLYGKHFAHSDNVVLIYNKAFLIVDLPINSESENLIEVTIPDDVQADNYTLQVTSNGKDGYFSNLTID